MRFRLLGPLEVSADGHPIVLGHGKRRAVLALLLLHANEVVPAERLIGQLWDEHPPATAAKRLQVCVSQLRRELAAGGGDPDVLRTSGTGYQLRVGSGELDVLEFGDAVASACRDLEEGRPERAAERARRALALWRGPPLVDFAYDAFAQQEIARLEEERLALMEVEIDADLALGRHGEVIARLEPLVEEHPFHERFSAQLMLALYRSGRQADALRVYRGLRGVLNEQLGLEPMPELRALEESVLHQDRALEVRRRREAPVGRRPGSAARAPPRPASRRLGQLLLVGGALFAGAGAFAIVQRGSSAPAPVPALWAAQPVLAALDAAGVQARVLFPLPGRPTAVAQGRGSLWVVTTDRAALTEVSARMRAIRRVVPLAGRPEAAAVVGGAVWVLDAERRRLMRVSTTDGTVSTVRYGTSTTHEPRGHAVLARAGDALWLSHGGRHLVRLSASGGSVSRVAVGAWIDDIAALRGSVWVLSTAAGAVIRVDAGRAVVTDRVPLGSCGAGAGAYPAHLVASPSAVWALCGSVPTLTRIDPRSRTTRTVRLPTVAAPVDLWAGTRTIWVAERGGTLARVDWGGGQVRSRRIADALGFVSVVGETPWVTTD